MINKKEAVKEAIAHRDVFPVPYFLTFDAYLEDKLRKHFHTDDLRRTLGDYIFYTPVVPIIPEGLVDGSYTDIFGVRWVGVGNTRGQAKDHPLKKPSMRGYRFPEPCPPKTVKRIERQIELHKDVYILVKLGDLFERAHFMRGMPQLLVDFYRNPNFVDELFRGITEYNLGVIERLSSLKIDGLWLSDDYGAQNGLLMSPRHWRRFIKPHLRAIIQKVHEVGFDFFLHSDGDITDLIPEIVELGVDVIQPLQSECIDIMEIKKRYGDAITIFSGTGAQGALLTKTPEEIGRNVRSLCRSLGKGGGFILCPGIQIMHNTPFENVLAFIDVAMHQEDE